MDALGSHILVPYTRRPTYTRTHSHTIMGRRACQSINATHLMFHTRELRPHATFEILLFGEWLHAKKCATAAIHSIGA